MRNLKAMGLALTAIFAMSAVAASAATAQGVQGKLTISGGSEATLDIMDIAGQVNAFTAFGGKTECPGTTYTGHQYNVNRHAPIPANASNFTLTPDIIQSNCKITVGGVVHKTTATMNGCDYALHVGVTTGTANQYFVTADIECPAGEKIVEDIYAFAGSELGGIMCEVTVGTQTGLSGPKLTSIAGAEDFEVHGTFTNIIANEIGSACPSEATNSAEWHINVTGKGTSPGGANTDITITD